MITKLVTAKRHIEMICFAFLLCIFFSVKAQEKYYRITAEIGNTEWTALKEKGLQADHFYSENGSITAELSASDLQVLKQNYISYQIEIRNLEKRIPKRNRKIDRKAAKKAKKGAVKAVLQQVTTPQNFELGSMGGFQTQDEALAVLDRMRQLYPDLITVKSSIGNSIQNRPIYMVKISDNADTDENEDEMLFSALHHAREPMGLAQMLYYMWYLLENYNSDNEIKTLVDHTELYFVPIVNPDGYVYNQQTNSNGGGFWRKNRRNNGGSFGVDLNRNYGYKWGTAGTNPNQDDYQGTSGFSEPETVAMKNFADKHEFVAALNYHSFGNLLIHPFGYSPNTFTPDQNLYVTMCKYMVEENNYSYGTPSQTVGYFASGSHDDWMYAEQVSKPKILAMAPEVGRGNDGFWPASSRIETLCKDAFPLNMKLVRMIAKYADLTPKVEEQTITEAFGSISFDLKRFSINPAKWTVSLSSNSSSIKTIGNSKEYNNIGLLETENGTISFELNTNTSKGTRIPMILTVDNGDWTYTKEVTIIYDGIGTPPPPVPSAVDGGTVITLDGREAVTTITGDGIADTIIFNKNTTSSASYRYLITDDAGKILGVETNSHNFEGASVGVCLVYGISYQGDLDVNGKNVSDVGLATGDYDVSDNWITVTRTAEVVVPPVEEGKTIAGKIEAEDYDNQLGVRSENSNDVGGGRNIGYIHDGDFTEYKVNVTATGTYTVDLRVASATNGGTIILKADGVSLGQVTVPRTFDWQKWETVSTNINLNSGSKTLRLEFSGRPGYLLNVNYMNFALQNGAKIISKEELGILKLYPNPTTENLQIHFEKTISQGTLKFFDNLGRLVKALRIDDESELNVDVSDFQSGFYYVRLFDGVLFSRNATFIKE